MAMMDLDSVDLGIQNLKTLVWVLRVGPDSKLAVSSFSPSFLKES